MPTHEPSARRGWSLFFCIGFLFLGVLNNFRSTFMPVISEAFSLGESQLSGLIVMGAVASILLQLSAGVWSERISPARLYLIAFIILTGALALSASMDGYPKLLAFYFVIQVGVTLYLLVSNTLIPTLGAGSDQLLTYSHGFYGLGATLSPLIAERLLEQMGSWQMSYQTLAYPSLALCLFIIYLGTPNRALFMKSDITTDTTTDTTTVVMTDASVDSTRPSLRQLIKRPLIWWFALLFGAGMTAEVATASWLVYYLCSTTQMPQAEAAIYLSGFYALFTLGRFMGGLILPAGGERRALHYALICSSVVLMLVVAFPKWSAPLLTLSGLTVALIFPMMLLIFNQSFSRHQASTLGVIISGALLVFMGINALVGLWGELFSIRTSYVLMMICAWIAIGCNVMIRRINTSKESI